jgi:PAS domain S-box-containing protein
MNLREIMTLHPILLQPTQTVQEATGIFLHNKIDGAPVVDKDNQLIGLLTKTHIFRMVSMGMDMSVPVEAVMTRTVMTGHPDDAAEDLLNPVLGRLPVVDNTGVVGIITRTDLARVFFNRLQDVSVEAETIINSTHNLIISVDGRGMVNVFNDSAERILELKYEDVKGKSITKIFPNSRLPEIIKTGKEELLQNIELKGKYFISNRSPIIKDNQVIGAVAVLQDISDVEQVSKELKSVKELNEELDAIIESSFDGLYITDGHGTALRVNKAFEIITGIPAQDFLNHNLEEHESEGIVWESVSSLVIKQKQPVTIIQKTRPGKTTLVTGNPVFDKKGRIIRVVCNVRDITELNLLKHKLEKVQGLSQHYEKQLRTMRLQYTNANMIARDRKMRELLDTVIRVAQVDSTVLITGESGTGKELVAEIIHNNSARKDKPFIKVNCGAIPENLLESELFGYEAGAFTGANKGGKPGYFELADGGTIFLDEIGDLQYSLQVKILRFLQDREISRLGGGGPVKVDVRILAATNRNLLDMIQKKQFREDLYYRLNVVPINVPPLRDRKEDIPGLVYHFIQMFNRKYQMAKRISPEVISCFMKYEWPGNVRELENIIERLVVVTSSDLIDIDNLPMYIGMHNLAAPRVIVTGILPMQEAIESLEKQLIEKAYSQFRTTRQMAAELKVNASTIVRKANRYGIS